MRTIALIALLAITPSPSTMAAVAVFAANAERKWPADDREPFVTAETLRLLEAAGRAIAVDGKVDTGKVHESIAAFASARSVLEAKATDEAVRGQLARDALVKGATMITTLATALDRGDAATRQALAALKQSADALDRKRQVRQQGDVMERYFHQAAELLRALIATPESPTSKS
jgi:hypothetical protein